ncbi:MAG: pyridoxamine 5'-phosphate oxidase [Burkholderiaceae bacterium]|nr:pyridoxamine 5'-phosphate oxidase [Burkholderiaceae bacterium]
MSITDLRREYTQASLSDANLLADPIEVFSLWFDEAYKAQIFEPNIMSVSTVGEDGRPSSRVMLLNGHDSRGFAWFNSYNSRKGQELKANPFAAILFFWPELERQIRIEGPVERVSDEENDAYFYSRPLHSRLSAVASAQSKPVQSREEMESHLAEVTAQYGDNPPRPASWGGYRLVPDRIEFWQGRRSRFHDRILFTRQPDGSWQHQRLQP